MRKRVCFKTPQRRRHKGEKTRESLVFLKFVLLLFHSVCAVLRLKTTSFFCFVRGNFPPLCRAYLKLTSLLCVFSETLDPGLVAAASAAASTLPNSHQAESELLQLLKKMQQHKALPEAQENGNTNNIGYVCYVLSMYIDYVPLLKVEQL